MAFASVSHVSTAEDVTPSVITMETASTARDVSVRRDGGETSVRYKDALETGRRAVVMTMDRVTRLTRGVLVDLAGRESDVTFPGVPVTAVETASVMAHYPRCSANAMR